MYVCMYVCMYCMYVGCFLVSIVGHICNQVRPTLACRSVCTRRRPAICCSPHFKDIPSVALHFNRSHGDANSYAYIHTYIHTYATLMIYIHTLVRVFQGRLAWKVFLYGRRYTYIHYEIAFITRSYIHTYIHTEWRRRNDVFPVSIVQLPQPIHTTAPRRYADGV